MLDIFTNDDGEMLGYISIILVAEFTLSALLQIDCFINHSLYQH